jgi:hypothetical protein
MASLIEKGFIERQNGNAHVQIPFNQSIFKSPTQINTASVSRRSQMASSSQQKPETTGNPLLRCWEYTLATSVESQLCSSKNQKLCPIADRILGPKNASKFMRHVSFEYDASKTITSSVDGNSKTGAFALTYTSPHSGKKFEVQTAEQLHEVLNEFAGKKLKVNSRFRSDVSAFFEGLHGGRLKNILRVQCGLQDLHETKVKDLQSLPDALLGIAGKIASKAQQRGASVPSYAPMNNQRHAFNMRLNDPILQEGIRTGAWESPEKRQAFLRQQLMEPMLAPTLDTNDARSASSMLQFFNDLENRFAALKKHAPSKTALKEVFGRIADELQGKVSYADLAKAAYKALKQEFPRIHDAALQENIMMALAPRCPQMMFADTNWEDNGRPEHWGMQFNPITGQFDVLKGILDDSGKYNFVRSELPGKFDECRIIDDPRILFRR